MLFVFNCYKFEIKKFSCKKASSVTNLVNGTIEAILKISSNPAITVKTNRIKNCIFFYILYEQIDFLMILLIFLVP